MNLIFFSLEFNPYEDYDFDVDMEMKKRKTGFQEWFENSILKSIDPWFVLLQGAAGVQCLNNKTVTLAGVETGKRIAEEKKKKKNNNIVRKIWKLDKRPNNITKLFMCCNLCCSCEFCCYFFFSFFIFCSLQLLPKLSAGCSLIQNNLINGDGVLEFYSGPHPLLHAAGADPAVK